MDRRRCCAVLVAVLALLAAACQGGEPEQPASRERPASAERPVSADESRLVEAVRRTRAEGNARTSSTFPDGVFPTMRVSGVVDFREGRSETVFEIVRADGVAVPYQRLVRTGQAVYFGRHLGPERQDEPFWERLPATDSRARDTAQVHVDGMTLLREAERQAADLPRSGTGRYERRALGPSAAPAPAPAPASASASARSLHGIVIHAVALDDDDRVVRIEFTLPTMRDEGLFAMDFHDFGAAPPVETPRRSPSAASVSRGAGQ